MTVALAAALALGGCGGPRDLSISDAPADASATPPPQPPTAPAVAGAVLELRLKLDQPPSVAAPRRILVVPAWGGANRGAARAEGWTSVPLAGAAAGGVELEAGAASVTVARGRLPEGGWDRVFVAADAVFAIPEGGAVDAGFSTAETSGASPEPIESHIEPIALGFDAAPGARIVAELDLVILDRPSRPGYWRIFVKDARIVATGSEGVSPPDAASGAALGEWASFGIHWPRPIRQRADSVGGSPLSAGGSADIRDSHVLRREEAMSHEETVRGYFRAIGTSTADEFTAHFTEDVHFEDPVGGRALQGHAGVTAFHKGLRRAWESIEMSAGSVFVRGDRAAAQWTARGRSTSGQDIDFEGINVFEFGAGGRIARLEGYWDFEGVIGRM